MITHVINDFLVQDIVHSYYLQSLPIHHQNVSNGILFVFLFFLGPHLWHMEVLRLGVESEL